MTWQFSEDEMSRRVSAIDAAMTEHEIRHLVVYGANRTGSAVQWLTGWPVTREAAVVHDPHEQDTMFIHFFNHIPQAKTFARNCEVRWAGRVGESLIEELQRRGARTGEVGVIGPVPFGVYRALSDHFGAIADLNATYTAMRVRKSEEELAVLREAARLTDLSCLEMTQNARIGSTDHDLVTFVEQAVRPLGGGSMISYFAITPMVDSQQCVPAQWPTGRVLRKGDVLSCELSTTVGVDYPGQLLRTFTVAEDPSPLVTELHEVADEALRRIEDLLAPGVLPEDVISAGEVIEEAGFTTVDDLIHGLGGGYLPPILGSRSRTLEEIPDTPFVEGMTVVVQPNVTTLDGTIGVQTGDLLEITAKGCRRMHQFPRGLGRIDDR